MFFAVILFAIASSASAFDTALQYHFSPPSDAPAFSVEMPLKLDVLPGKPIVAVSVALWKSPTRWNPSRDPIWSTTISLGFQMMNLELGPHVTQTWNSLGEQVTTNRTYRLLLKKKF
jgi:hypothetical protein